jgi:hypothetical protein
MPQQMFEEARRRLMAKGGLPEIADPDSDVEIVAETTASSTSKKAKTSDGKAVAIKRGLDAFLERTMTSGEKDQSNVRMLRYVATLFLDQWLACCNLLLLGSLFMGTSRSQQQKILSF